jgi:U3 small nucleolar ribonucleoprotein protein IMP3
MQPDDYRKYNVLCGSLRQLAHRLAALDPADPFRRKHEELLLEKLFDMGILGTGGGGKGKLSDVEHKVTVSAFARRRLPVVMTRLRMADHVQVRTPPYEHRLEEFANCTATSLGSHQVH